MPYGCTEAFLTRHVRNLATMDDTSQAAVVRHAGVILTARQEEFGHEYPNSVMFINPNELGQIQAAGAHAGANAHLDVAVRLPFVVTWVGAGHYEVVTDAAGFSATTDADGAINHYGGVRTDHDSQASAWDAPGL